MMEEFWLLEILSFGTKNNTQNILSIQTIFVE